ncbi:bifunctional hydroxymethylpyrimidine kinase/phosphomethylpyrimidine kinase [Labrys neptuniae]|uniref:bifunctional hydroxymethylpyrimidine kinase/phosphomethylpyrimidine kinase n=1 Tax=Labrys neptuniae TaxID=376174 RepID=UPI0028908470|nr:bifunctional hydroxymethylpyrimidine kinase/phosphomethylpyrimidine kinase [Labrys neptuniae]MDT3379540.1 bifunctional hydroxymethylpyrimidine kinase/phosphomethylpyrimidine kinase [Labrys neptuniae]
MTAIALSIAGSDSGGGAGIQADLAAFRAFGVFGTTVITAVTAQNTRGISAIHAVPLDVLAAQLDAVLDDFEVRAIKIGMVPSAGHARAIAERLTGLGLPIVLDPVMSASTGRLLGETGTLAALKADLLPLATCLTPNLPEAAILLNEALAESEAQMIEQAQALLEFGPRAVLLKGGHGHLGEAVDILATRDDTRRFAGAWVRTPNLHGTGCALSSAIAANLAGGRTLAASVGRAKEWLADCLKAGIKLQIGCGCGPAVPF